MATEVFANQKNVFNAARYTCYHCGDPCPTSSIVSQNHFFCCEGCKLIFEVLDDNQLTQYYAINPAPGVKDSADQAINQYAYLDDEKIRNQLVTFTNGKETHVTFHIPQIHCSSCIWLLEHLHRLDHGIFKSTVNFLKREVHIRFNTQETHLAGIAGLLHKLGYAPLLRLSSLNQYSDAPSTNRSEWFKLGIAFFCFGNIMLLSFPDYFGLDTLHDASFRTLFGYLNLALSLPVLLYADTEFFRNALNGIRNRRMNMDVPISLGIVVMYCQSFYQIVFSAGPGYMDTFSGLVFFMLAGRMFQNKSYEKLSFERDYKSYFPVAAAVLHADTEVRKPVQEIVPGDVLVLRHGELIPVDGVLKTDGGWIDYSFVTGESNPVAIKRGETLYAGGRQLGGMVKAEALKSVSQSRLIQLWNDSSRKPGTPGTKINSVADRLSRVFTLAVLVVAAGAFSWHALDGNPTLALKAFTSVLIITCPCALALSYPFTLGNSSRILGRNGLFLKNATIVESLAATNALVFDKTGTLTEAGYGIVSFEGTTLNREQMSLIRSVCNQSMHPLSRAIVSYLEDCPTIPVENFKEHTGNGLAATFGGTGIKIGSLKFVSGELAADASAAAGTCVHVSFNSKYAGAFSFRVQYREGWESMVGKMGDSHELHLISGDNDKEKDVLAGVFGEPDHLHFNQNPEDKKAFITALRNRGKRVVMMGDGLNDAGALIASDAGIAITDNENNFSPAADAILKASSLAEFAKMVRFSKQSMQVIYASYLVSVLYNLVGISFAVRGALSPLTAAIIMPLSTVSIILLAVAGTRLMASRSQLIR